MASRTRKVFLGTFIYSKSREELSYLVNTAVCVDESGKIAAVREGCDRAKVEAEVLPELGWSLEEVEVRACEEGQFFFPGFVDTHIHAPQYPNVGIFGKTTLMDWLSTYTFPMEAKLAAVDQARRVYTAVIRRMISHGTTSAAIHAARGVESTNLLADLCLSLGLRALVGRVCMDEKRTCPDFYCDESPEDSVLHTRACIAHVQEIDPGFEMVKPVITPRFAPSCTAAALGLLGELRKETGLPVQTHISENAGEMALVAELFPDVKDYATVYDVHGLLGPDTILAHAVHLSEDEAALIAERGAKVSHCPSSNSCLTSGHARVRWLWDRGVEVGLGTDMSGGYSPSVLENARQASLVSRHVAVGIPDGPEKERAKLTVEEVLYLATRGGARVMGLGERVGAFEVGMEFDAVLVGLGLVGEDGVAVGEGNVDVFGWETWEEKIAKWLFNGDDRNCRAVWVRGTLVHERA
ncbi:related to guanine deaminase [Cephalotrichum gorgonifer]|uniref:Probable guanine deaminase n=1 Tax=Cephalotrichum gorgonifer TaxID=2041049 RepID=A0AAE8SSR5_9PEZI|nr:related to guanine deaminase [Cephalotrichum gorgonifer]